MLIVQSLIASVAALPPQEASWRPLSTSPVLVECSEAVGGPWCRSYGVINAPIDQVAESLRDMATSAHLFESVLRIDVLSDDVLHITLDYPTPLADRDYVAHYSHANEGQSQIFTWEPVAHERAPVTDAAVRLPNFAGEWRLEPRGSSTWVRYTWQAEIAGSFPSWAYEVAWRRAGQEALRDLARTRKATLSAVE